MNVNDYIELLNCPIHGKGRISASDVPNYPIYFYCYASRSVKFWFLDGILVVVNW